MFERIVEAWDGISREELVLAAVGLLVLLILVWLVRRRRAPSRALQPPDLGVDVAAIPSNGPDAGEVQLQFYGTPVRLAVLVIAPVGRDGSPPELAKLPDLLDQLVPGMKAVFHTHQPRVRVWPNQLSAHGFIHAFFNSVTLPGDRGRGTPWCSLAGKFRGGGEPYLAGLVLCAAAPNGLGQFEIQHEGQWNDMLRIKASGS